MGNATSWLTQSRCPLEQALWVAAKSGDRETLQKGLERLTSETRFHAEWRDPVYGYSPLANACSQGHFHCVQALLAYGVDANARDAQGNTPLHIATSCGKSEIVRLLLETPAVDYFAKTATKAQTALDIARQGYKVSEGRGLQYIQCVEHIEKKLCLYSGWLYERSDNFLSIASGISGLDSWKKRYAMALRTDVGDVIEIDLFPMKPGERRPPVPGLELLYKTSDGIQQSDDVTWLNRKEFRLSLKVSRKHGSSRSSAVQSMGFAAANQEELAAWKTFLATLRVNAPASSATTATRGADSRRTDAGSRCTDADSRRADTDSRRADTDSRHVQSSQPAACCSSSCSPTQAAILQEQRDLERALQLSLEEARRHSRTQSAPSAPPPSDTMLEALNYSGTVVGPDGVEIVQLLGGDNVAVARRILSPHSVSSHLVTSADRQEAQHHDECVICFDGPQEAVCVPCGHNAVCMSCAQELLDTTGLCPVCRQQVREVIRLYRV